MRGDPETVAFVLGLRRSGAEYKGPCPLCGGRDRFHVRRGNHHDLIVHCRAGCRFADIAALLKSMNLIEDDRPVWSASDDSEKDFEPLMRAYMADVARGCASSAQRVHVRRALYRELQLSPDEFLSAWFICATYKGNLKGGEILALCDDGDWRPIRIELNENDRQNFETFSKLIEGYEWAVQGVLCLSTTH